MRRSRNQQPTLMIVAGGTGGHIFPGLAVARQMEALGWHVVWLGNRSGLEATIVPQYGIAIEFIRFGGVRGKGLLTKLMLPINLLRAAWQSGLALGRQKPDVMLAMGGYLTVPAGLMAVLTGRPLVLHEQNSIVGLANRLLSKVARQTLVAFPKALPHATYTGNPIREEFSKMPPPSERYAERTGPLRLLVVGGSLGAAALNEVVPRALALLDASQRPQVIHQAGDRHLEQLRANYQAAGLVAEDAAQIELVPFINDMAQAYAQADLVISRAGAMSVAEIAAVGVAALLVPFPYAVDDHQTTNAAFLAEHEAALVVQQKDLSAEKLADWLKTQTRQSLLTMAQRARVQAMPEAAEQVAQVCASLNKRAASFKNEFKEQ